MSEMNTEKKAKKPSKKVLITLAIAVVVCIIIGVIIYSLTRKLILAAVIGIIITVVSAVGLHIFSSNISKLKIAKEKGIDGMKVGALKDMTMSIFAIIAVIFICYVIVDINIPRP